VTGALAAVSRALWAVVVVNEGAAVQRGTSGSRYTKFVVAALVRCKQQRRRRRRQRLEKQRRGCHSRPGPVEEY
jgi:hypothetical protein